MTDHLDFSQFWQPTTGEDAPERERDIEIAENRKALAENVRHAVTDLAMARQALNRLASPQVYDIELVEGTDNYDLSQALDVASRELRNAGRIVENQS